MLSFTLKPVAHIDLNYSLRDLKAISQYVFIYLDKVMSNFNISVLYRPELVHPYKGWLPFTFEPVQYRIGTWNSVLVPNGTFFRYFTLCVTTKTFISVKKNSIDRVLQFFLQKFLFYFSDNQIKAWKMYLFFIKLKWISFIFCQTNRGLL